jgi:hypothetical protein
MKSNVQLCALIGLLLGSVVLGGCQGTAAITPPAPPLNETEMAGPWVGTMAWTTAGEPPSSTRFVLKGDGTLSGSSSVGGALSGTWSVSGADYTDRFELTTRMGTYFRTGTVSGSTISGTFTSDRGASGTFEMTKK